MKKVLKYIEIVVIFLFLFFPVRIQYKDGGSVEYRAVMYQVIDVHSLADLCSTGYNEGIVIKILGLQVFNNTSCDIVVDVHHVENVTMTIKEGTLTDTGMVVVIEDLNEEKYVFGELFYLEKKENDSWVRIDPINAYGFNDMGYLVNEDNILEMKQDWSYMYGSLESGNYRLVKSVYKGSNSLYFSVEFSL